MLQHLSEFLIYPYWNVNVYDWFRKDKNQIVSNLSILECKCGQSANAGATVAKFLIYPYWNVNVDYYNSKDVQTLCF